MPEARGIADGPPTAQRVGPGADPKSQHRSLPDDWKQQLANGGAGNGAPLGEQDNANGPSPSGKAAVQQLLSEETSDQDLVTAGDTNTMPPAGQHGRSPSSKQNLLRQRNASPASAASAGSDELDHVTPGGPGDVASPSVTPGRTPGAAAAAGPAGATPDDAPTPFAELKSMYQPPRKKE